MQVVKSVPRAVHQQQHNTMFLASEEESRI